MSDYLTLAEPMAMPDPPDDVLRIETPTVVMVLNPPRSRLACALLRWLGIDWRPA